MEVSRVMDIICTQLKNFANEWEIFFQKSEVNEIHLLKNKIHFVNKTFDSGYGIRIHEGGLGFSSSNIFTEEAVQRTIKNAFKNAKLAEKVEFSFPTQKPFRKVKCVDKKIKEENEELLRNYIDEMLENLPPKVFISFGKVRTYDSKIRIVNSEGLDVEREETHFMVELSLMVKGKKVEFWPHEYRKRIDDLPAMKVKEWGKVARDQVKATQPKTEKTTVIFSPSTVLDGLGSVLGYHSTGSAKVNEVTKFVPEEKFASEKLTIVDDGLYPFGLMTSEFDDEGNPQKRRVLMKNGVFKDFIYDQFYALKDGRESTGNGFRQAEVFYIFDSKYVTQPSNQISNFYVKPGRKSLEELIEEVEHGILIKKFSWLSPDQTSGSFSSEIRAGYYIEKGEIAEPIKGGLVAGNFFDLIQRISGISNVSEITSGGTILAGVCPYIRFEDVQVAGR